MDIKKKAHNKLKEISEDLGAVLEIRKLWSDEYSELGFYFRFYGLIHDTRHLKIEVVGSYWYGVRNGEENEEIDIFPFINGMRVSPCNTENYIWK